MRASVPEFPMRLAAAPGSAPYDWARVIPSTLTARLCAYLCDLLAISLIATALSVALFVLGIPSLGATWALIVPVWAVTPIVYSGLTLSSPAQATLGMRLLGLSLRGIEDAPIDFLIGAAHALLFYVFAATMSPLVLLLGLLRADRALLHDIVLRVRLVAAAPGY